MTIRRKGAQKEPPEAVDKTSDPLEQRIVAFAEQLGLLVGTVQTKAEGWLDRKALTQEIGRIRDRAADLLEQVNLEGTLQGKQGKTAAKQTTTSGTRLGRGPVDAPGKRHRKPLPQQSIDKHMGDPRGKQMGQKSAKTGRRGGRG